MILRLLSALFTFLCFAPSQSAFAQDRIPFYEDYFRKSDLNGFLRQAKIFLEKKPEAPEAPRLAMDYLMAGKAARNIEAVNRATGYLLFKYQNSLPTLHLLSSFEKGSDKLKTILKTQAEIADLSDKQFADAYCRTLILIARAQDPELFKDSGIRLRAYLLATTAEVEEIQKIAAQTLSKQADKGNAMSKVVKVVFSEDEIIKKIEALEKVQGDDARFCMKYYMSQLTESQLKSPEILTLQIKQGLFEKAGDMEKVFQAFESLPSGTVKLPKYQAFLGLAQHLDEKDEDAIKTLRNISTTSSDKTAVLWGKTARAYADGLQSSENRKKLLLGALGKAIDRLSQKSDAWLLEAKWQTEGGEGKTANYHAHLAISKSAESFEIQVRKDKEMVFAFRTDPKKASVIPPMGDVVISFASPGALPVPQASIVRNVSDGSFNYNFNLSFASTFARLEDMGSGILKNPYVGTAKGREVLVSYLLGSKPIWLGPAKSIRGGTSYPVYSLSPDEPVPTYAELAFDVSGELTSCSFGDFSLPSILRGDAGILEKMPKWPDLAKKEEAKFDFALFMQMISQLSKTTAP